MGMTDALCRATPGARVTFAVTEESYFPGLIGPTRQSTSLHRILVCCPGWIQTPQSLWLFLCPHVKAWAVPMPTDLGEMILQPGHLHNHWPKHH